MKRLYLILIILFLSSSLPAAQQGFNYEDYFKRFFVAQTDDGKIIPLVTEKATELDGSLTPDGEYLVYAADREKSGFDIYLRYMRGIDIVKITSHASDDLSPVISPDGKYLAFVSRREDPEGDIFIMDIDPKEIIEDYKGNPDEEYFFDKNVKNITLEKYENDVLKTVKDSYPAWSPDSKMIAYSSIQDGEENIWICDRSGENKRKLTARGGIYPSFSPDGKEIVFVSYRDGKRGGDLYSINIFNKNVKRITDLDGIKLTPAYLKNKNEIVYTLIDKDTNRDGIIDLKDNSILSYYNISKKIFYPLTSYNHSSFGVRWFPAFAQTNIGSTVMNFNGVLVYSEEKNNNINLNILPEIGIIPKRTKAKFQYQLAEEYIYNYDDVERYLMALERVYFWFKDNKDVESKIYVAKALKDAILKNISVGNKIAAKRLLKYLGELSSDKNDFSSILASHCQGFFTKHTDYVLKKAYSGLRNEKKFSKYYPYLIEELADYYNLINKNSEAVKYYNEVRNNYKKFNRINNIYFNLSKMQPVLKDDKISGSYMYVLSYGRNESKDFILEKITSYFLRLKFNEKNRLYKKLSDYYNIKIKEIEADKSKKKSLAKKEIASCNLLLSMLEYSLGYDLIEQDKINDALIYLNKSYVYLKKIRNYQNKLFFYKINNALAHIANLQKKYDDEAEYIYQNARNYQLKWKQKDFRIKLNNLIEYFENKGESLEIVEKYKESVLLYKKYREMLNYLQLKKGVFDDIYHQYGIRAEILYINSSLKNKPSLKTLKKLENEYRGMLTTARGDYKKAHIYALGYINSIIADYLENKNGSFAIEYIDELGNKVVLDSVASFLREAIDQCDWALFIEDSFSDPYLLKGWIYQFIDLKRKNEKDIDSEYNKLFSQLLLEKSLNFYEKAINANNEELYPQNEANLNINLANSYFILQNYDFALKHYEEVLKYKNAFSSKLEEALFYYHISYCYWQSGRIDDAFKQMKKVENVFNLMNMNPNSRLYRERLYSVYKYYALFSRYSGNYNEAIKWYRKIQEIYPGGINKVRLKQELAYSYMMIGSFDTALKLLQESDSLLRTEKDIEYGKSRLEFGLLYIIPIGFSKDPIIIGNNKIFSQLSLKNKKLLNLSLKEKLFLMKGELYKSIEYLERKLKFIEDDDDEVSVKIKIVSLNNLGLYNFKLGDYQKAEKYFEKAKSLAANPAVNDLEGLFVAIRNFSNLYSVLLERDDLVFSEADYKIKKLLNEISDYKKNYEKIEFEKGYQQIKDLAKAKDKKINEADVKNLKLEIKEKAKAKFQELNFTKALLDFYLIELNSSKFDKPFDVYVINKNNFRKYSHISRVFQNALDNNVSSFSSRKKSIIMLNNIIIKLKLGERDIDDLFITTEKFCSANYITDILWQVYYQKALWKIDHGDIKTALNYLERSLEIVRDIPYLYSDNIGKISTLYKVYTLALLESGNKNKAWKVTVEGSEVIRALTFYNSNVLLKNNSDRTIVSDFKNIIVKIKERIYNSMQLVSGNEKISYEKYVKEYDKLKKEYFYERDKIKTQNKKLYDIIFSSTIMNRIKPGSTFFKLYVWRKKIYIIGKNNEKIFYKKLNSPGDLKVYINKNFNNNSYALLNNDLISNIFSFKEKGLTVLSSIYRADYFNTPLNLSKISTSENILEDSTFLFDLNDSLGFRKIFDGSNNSDFIIKEYRKRNFEDYILESEAAFYRQSSGFIYLFSGVEKKQLVKNYINKSTVNLLTASKPLNLIGNNITQIEANKKESQTGSKSSQASLKEKYYKSCTDDLENKKYAAIDLKIRRYAESGATELEIALLKTLMYLSQGNTEKAMAEITKDYSRNSDYDNYKNKILSYKVYISLLQLKTKQASKLLDGNTNSFLDFKVYKNIIDLINGKNIEIKFSGKSIVSSEALKILSARYLYLLGNKKDSSEMLKFVKPDIILSEKDMAISHYIRGTLPVRLNNNQMAMEVIDKISGETSELQGYFYAGVMKELWETDRINILINVYENFNWGLFNNKRMIDDFILAKEIYNLLILIGENSRTLQGSKFLYEKNINKSSGYFNSILKLNYIRDLIANKKFENADSLIKAIDKTFLKKYSLYEYFLMLDCELKNVSTTPLLSFESSKKLIKSKDFQWSYIGHLLRAQMYRHIILLNFQSARKKVHKDVDLWKLIDHFSNDKELYENIKNIQNGFVKYEEHLLSSLDFFNRKGSVKFFNKRFDLLLQGLDFIIFYNTSRGKYLEALKYSEIKKQLKFRNKFQPAEYSITDDKVYKDFSKLNSRSDESVYIDLIGKNPGLYLEKNMPILPILSFQQKLEDEDVVFYLDKNENNIICWIITSDFIEPKILLSSFPGLNSLVENYRQKLLTKENINDISENLNKSFRRLNNFYKNKNRILFIIDDQLEQIPFELLGNDNKIVDTHIVQFLHSISLSFLTQIDRPAKLFIEKNDKGYLEEAALRQSGINIENSSDKASIMHLISTIDYRLNSREMKINNANINFKDKILVWANANYFNNLNIVRTTDNDIAAYLALQGVKSVIINRISDRDVNVAHFCETFYKNIKNRVEIFQSFSKGVFKLISLKLYSHPAYWQGLRLYTNSP